MLTIGLAILIRRAVFDAMANLKLLALGVILAGSACGSDTPYVPNMKCAPVDFTGLTMCQQMTAAAPLAGAVFDCGPYWRLLWYEANQYYTSTDKGLTWTCAPTAQCDVFAPQVELLCRQKVTPAG